MPPQLENAVSLSTCILRSLTVLVSRPRSSAKPELLTAYCSLSEDGKQANLYPLPPTCSHLSRGSMYSKNRKGESVSPCSVPLCTSMAGVSPCPTWKYVVASAYKH